MHSHSSHLFASDYAQPLQEESKFGRQMRMDYSEINLPFLRPELQELYTR